MTITVTCKAAAISKTKKGSYKIVFVTPNAEVFTTYTKEQLTVDDVEEFEIECERQFDVNLTDTPLFLHKEDET